jgi:hypothetical protein
LNRIWVGRRLGRRGLPTLLWHCEIREWDPWRGTTRSEPQPPWSRVAYAGEVPRTEDGRRVMSRHLAPPEAFSGLQDLRDIDLLEGVYDEAGEYRSPGDLALALQYHQEAYMNPFTHQDYGDPNYKTFGADKAYDPSVAMGHFISDPENPVARGLMAMNVMPGSMLEAARNDSREEDVLGRIARGFENQLTTNNAMNAYKRFPIPVLDIQGGATSLDKMQRSSQLAPLLDATIPASGQEALHGLGVPGNINTPAAGLATEIASGALDPSPFGTAVGAGVTARQMQRAAVKAGQAAPRLGPLLGKRLALDAGFDAGVTSGITAATAPPTDRTWSGFATDEYIPPSEEDATASANRRTRMSGQLVGMPGLREYRSEAQQAGSRRSGMLTPGGSTLPMETASAEERLRALKKMYDRPYDPR